MKKLLLVGGLIWAVAAHAGSRDAQWKKVQEAIGKGLPKTAVEELEPIIKGALADKAYAEAIKAVGQKIALEGNIQGNKPEEKIFRLQDEIAKYPVEMRPALEAVLAHWYWHYFQQNRWRFMQRTQTAEAPGKNLQTWDLPRILAEIDKHFTAALADDKALKATTVSAYDALLVKGSMPDKYRPTMFDFIAHEALQFYTAGEQGGAQAEDEFVLEAGSPIFGTAAEFLKWQPGVPSPQSSPRRGEEAVAVPSPQRGEGQGEGDSSPTLKAIRMYQQLLLFHQKDEDKTAFVDADLDRLIFGHNKATGEDKNSRYKAALKRFVDGWAGHEVSARALYEWAVVLNGEDDHVEARKLAERGLDAHPKSVGAAMCFNLIKQIEAKSASIQTERVWNSGRGVSPIPSNNTDRQDACSTINVTYRNVTKVYFRAVPYNFDAYLRSQRWGLYRFDDKHRQQLLAKTPALEWNADLPATKDFKERTEKLPAPKTLKPGFYFIVASHDASFQERQNQVSVAPVWVSDLALVLRQRHTEGVLEGFVLQANSGEPVAGATVQSWQRDREGWFKPVPETKTDSNGLFRLAGDFRGLVVAEANGQQLASANEMYVGHYAPNLADSQTVFFTDRALYRPGQTIYYKGVSVQFDQNAGKYSTFAGLDLTVVFNDPNGKEIARAQHKTNDYGSFDGAFTAPRDRVMGRMTIQVFGRPSVTSFNVEEYKRPKFQVELAAPKEAAKLNSEVALTGKATAYTGSAIGGAKVKWRVVREVQFPPWCWWGCFRFGSRGQAAQNIAHGTAITGNDGSFEVKFIAKPDPAVTEKEEPTFVFKVYADVTDTTGETRSDERSVRAGFTALQATLAADDWQTPAKPVEFKIETKSLDGDPQKAEGRVKLYRLKQPKNVARAELNGRLVCFSFMSDRTGETPVQHDPANPDSWELGEVAGEKGVVTDEKGLAKIALPAKTGIYRAMLETKDRFGKPVTARMTFQVVEPKSRKYGVKVPNHFTAETWTVEPGNSLLALWGTGYDKGRAFVELECNGKTLRSYWTDAGRTQELIKQAVSEEMRGGLTLRVTYVRENRAYLNERIVDVPWSNKELSVKWESFRSKLAPGQKETWTAIISKRSDGAMENGSDGKSKTPKLQNSRTPLLPAVAEMVAGLYDASLDQYLAHDWARGFGVFRHEWDRVNAQFENSMQPFRHIFGWWHLESRGVDMRYRQFPPDLVANLWGYGYFGPRSRGAGGMMYKSAAQMPAMSAVTMEADAMVAPAEREMANAADAPPEKKPFPAAPDLSKVTARKNLNETAFFLPHLMSDADGTVKMEFTMPEALTEWKFLGFAHDKELRAGYLTGKTVTAKDLMVEPNPPRFVREGDVIEFTVKVSNQSAERLVGKVKLTFADARTLASRDAALGNDKNELSFDVPAKESRGYSWRLSIPDGCEFLTYKAVGATDGRRSDGVMEKGSDGVMEKGSDGKNSKTPTLQHSNTPILSDGEEGFLPVLSRRIFVTESLPLPIRGKQTKEFAFAKLLESGKSDTLKHQALTVQMVSQPAWYAVMALPYLMEYPYECSEQIFNRLYANSLARHIAKSDPKIRRIFDMWKNSGTGVSPVDQKGRTGGTPVQQPLDSPLEKNQDLKSVMLEETPWYRQAMNEKQARRNVGILFDANRLNDETARTLQKLTEMQMSDGRWPWFPGGWPNEYITLYIVTGFGRMRHLGVDIDTAPAKRALTSLDAWMQEHYRRIENKEAYVPSCTDALYLYGRSFFLKDQAITGNHKEAVDYFLRQSRKFWLKTDCRQTQAHLAIALLRFGDKETPPDIMKSIKERSVSNEELGMFWRETELSWWWYRAPIETQAMMIEAFAEVMNDAQAVDDCQTWLLKQKQTQDWKTTKATADAVYALLVQRSDGVMEKGSDGKSKTPAVQHSNTPLLRLASDALVEVALAGNWIKTENVEAGTGFYEQKFVRGEVKPEMGKITVKKSDEGVSWGSVHWQYLEDMTKVTPHEGTPLKLKKTLWVKETGKTGQVLKPVKGALKVGDELVVRVELRTDRDMEYVHLKDQRGSGTEPVSVLSQYKFQDGLRYYESTRDTASHFFIDYLPKGVYVFEYSTRIQLKGKYQTGIAEIQCMYAPEFNSHSESFTLEVK
jgi:uncharacterized protein YfaS (alpha-2-macroglobulin family)